MTDKIDAFLTEVRNMPGFVAAAANDPRWLVELERVERALIAVDRRADDDPALIEIFDKIQDVVGRTGMPIMQRLLEVGKLLVQARDAIIMIH